MKKFPKGIYSYVLMMGHLCADISGGALPAILPFLITEKGITYAAAAGLTFALSSIGSVIQPVFGSMADKTSRPWLMALGIFMSGCGISMLGFIDSYWMMFAAVAFTGIGSALFHPVQGCGNDNFRPGEHFLQAGKQIMAGPQEGVGRPVRIPAHRGIPMAVVIGAAEDKNHIRIPVHFPEPGAEIPVILGFG